MSNNAKSRYDAATARYYSMKLNTNTDAALIEHIEKCAKGNVQGYLKQLIRDDMTRGENKMTSRNYYTGHMVGETALNDMIANLLETADDNRAEQLADAYRQYMTEKLEALDDRLWWQPETSEVFWQDDGSEHALPDVDAFPDWWNDTTSSWIESLND